MDIYNGMRVYRDGVAGEGCIGGFFYWNGGPDIYAISNNHVLANLGNCSVGDPIYQLGTTNQLGTLQTWKTLATGEMNYLDIAFFKLGTDAIPRWKLQGGLNEPRGIRQAAIGEPVYLVRNDGSTQTGAVSIPSIDFEIDFNLLGATFPFIGLIEITPDSAPFSIPGESGSIIFSADNFVLGVLIGTNADTSKSYAIPFINDGNDICTVFNPTLWPSGLSAISVPSA